MPDEIIIRFSVRDDGTPQIEKLNKTLGKTKEASQSLVPGLESARTSMTGFMSANASLIAVLVGVGLAFNKIIKDEIAYTDQIRNLSALSGQGAEATSRFLQVLDDYEISAQDAEAATRALTNNGLAPSIETLAKLSDAYLKINSVEEKNKFVIENLGRGGMKWVQVLNQGSAAIMKQGNAVDGLLLRNQKQLDDALKLKIANDNLKESWEGIAGIIATKAIPVLEKLASDELDLMRARQMAKEDGINVWLTTEKQAEEYIALAKAERESATAARLSAAANQDGVGAANDNADAVDAQKEAVEAAQQALDDYKNKLEEISQANQDAEAFIQSYADFQKDYDEQHLDALGKIGDAEAKLYEARTEEYTGKDANKNRTEAINEATEALKEAKKEVKELEASWHETTNSMIYDMALAKITLDGYTDAEFAAMQKVAVERGLRTQEQADEAIRMMEEANAIVEGVAADEAVVREQSKIDATTAEMEKQLEIEKTAEAAITGAEQSAQAQADFAATVDSATLSLLRQAEAAQRAAGMVASIKMPGAPVNSGAKATNKGGGSNLSPKNANGLDFVVPMSYGYEGFNAGQLGTISGGEHVNITPSGQGGSVYNITVNNPIRETAEKSMRRELMSLSISGEPA